MKGKKKTKLYDCLIALCAVVFLVSGGMLGKQYLERKGYQDQLDQLASMFPEETPPAGEDTGESAGKEAGEKEPAGEEPEKETEAEMTVPPQEWKAWWAAAAGERFPQYRALKEQNPDFVGWVRIEGTRIDYPVVQTPEEPDFYLHRDFQKNPSSYGIPYMAEACVWEEPGTSLLIYGHHMRDGGMFAALQNYTEKSYYRQHPYIQFDTISRAGSYEIVAVVKVDAASNSLPWQQLLFPGSEAEFAAAWEAFAASRFYQTDAFPEYEDRLLALVTCEYTLKDGRLMVVAREIP